MGKWLIAILILFPVIEIWGILLVGDWLGGLNTFLLLITISVLGAFAASMEGKKVWFEAQRQMQYGQIPGRSFIKGVCVLLGGILLLLPGFFSDIIGLILLLPITRPLLEGVILTWIESWMKNGKFMIRRF